MKKQLLILTIGASFLLANSNETDLLSQVTKNSINGSQYELSNQDMEKVDGGYTSFGSPVPQVFYGGIANQMQNLLEKSTQKTTTSTSISNSSNTTVKRMADIVKPGSKPTFVTQSQINSGRY
ncbi:hypothetical protein [Aliarcobacter cryaerophilus]|uniref:hypothetical protein n=1 Tax=Aliarcobacter cryaerophilus TaxID=28198 RepID=UPI000824632D|nr:hypothetical protein [Aliarcobacter cryaerophilus]